MAQGFWKHKAVNSIPGVLSEIPGIVTECAGISTVQYRLCEQHSEYSMPG